LPGFEQGKKCEKTKKTILSGHLESIAVQFLLRRGSKRSLLIEIKAAARDECMRKNTPPLIAFSGISSTEKNPLGLCEGERALAWFLKIKPFQSSYVP